MLDCFLHSKEMMRRWQCSEADLWIQLGFDKLKHCSSPAGCDLESYSLVLRDFLCQDINIRLC